MGGPSACAIGEPLRYIDRPTWTTQPYAIGHRFADSGSRVGPRIGPDWPQDTRAQSPVHNCHYICYVYIIMTPILTSKNREI